MSKPGRYTREKFELDLRPEVARECTFCGREINLVDILQDNGRNRVVIVDTQPDHQGWVVWDEKGSRAVVDEKFQVQAEVRYQRHRCPERKAQLDKQH